MPSNTPEYELGHNDETVDEHLDGRESQPVAERSSDDPRNLIGLDPLRDAELLADEMSGHEARAGAEEIPALNEERVDSESTDKGDGQRIGAG